MRIAISGAGVAGTALAYWLHRTGHSPTLIEQAPAFRTGGYMIDFWGVGYQVAKRMGIEEQLRAAGYDIEHVRSVDSRGQVKAELKVDAIRDLIGHDYTSLPRGDLAETVYRTVEDKVETIFGDSITSIDDHGDGVRVTFEHAEPGTSIWSSAPTGCTPMCAGWSSAPSETSSTTSAARWRPAWWTATSPATSWST